MNVTEETLQLMKDALSKPSDALAKSITIGTGLVAYDLQAPAKNLYPVITPLRNSIPRVGGGTGTATNWRQVSAIIGSGVASMPWVPEGQRSGRMSYTTANKAASYVTLGEEDQITFEAKNASKNFEDLNATMVMRLLQQTMIKEEHAILGGNTSVSLGTPTTPTLSASGSGATLPTLTYDVAVVALTYEGFQAASLVGGVVGAVTVTGADGLTYSLKGGSSQKSAVATQAVTLGQSLFASTPAITGAVAYAWYIGAAGAAKLEAITSINSLKFSTVLAGTGQAIAAITADNSKNATAFDGLLYSAFASGSGAYINNLATGVSGTGTPLTTGGRGNVVEIDTMLGSMWDNFRLSPTVIYVNRQELKNITDKVLSNASAPLLRYDATNSDPYALTANGVISAYFNPFALNGGIKIPIKLHPTVPAGTIIGYCENLPAQYQNNEVPNVAEMKMRQDYYQIDWPLKTRQFEHGVYCEEVLAVYAPFGTGIITNIGNG